MNVHHDGSPENASMVNVTYLHKDNMHRVTADRVVMCGQQHLNKRCRLRLCPMPMSKRWASSTIRRSLPSTLRFRNWKFMDKLGVASVRWFGDDMGGWFTSLRRQMILDGEEPMPLDPEKAHRAHAVQLVRRAGPTRRPADGCCAYAHVYDVLRAGGERRSASSLRRCSGPAASTPIATSPASLSIDRGTPTS